MNPDRWQRIDSLLDQALDLDPQHRDQFIADACAGDDSLERELRSLLAAYRRVDSFIETPPADVAAALLSRNQACEYEMIAHYRLLDLIGAGGMGKVYLAEDTRLGRRVALKLLSASLTGDDASRARFLREARLASSLDHPNICTIHEVGESSGQHFIAMQFVEGKTLKDVINGQPLSLDSLLSISLQVGVALSEAHSRAIVHRDIKSSNIIITPRGQTKVLDFGLAKLLEKDDSPPDAVERSLSLTRSGAAIGTPTYMSPEQARGEAADFRSDIFSFGVVLYEMATGRLPFREGSQAETMNAVINKAHRPAAEMSEDVPEGLSAVIDRALAKLPDDRYQSIDEMIAELRRVAQEAGFVGGSTPDGAVVPYVVPERRSVMGSLSGGIASPVWLAIAAAVVMSLAIGAFVLERKGRATSAQLRSIAVLPFKPLDASSRDEALEMGMANTLITKLSNLREMRVRSIETVSRYAGIEADPVEAGRQLQVDSVLYGHIQKSGEQIRVTVRLVRVSDGEQLWGEVLNDAYVNIFAVQDSISEKVVSSLALKLSGQERERLAKHYTENAEAYLFYIKGRYHLDKRESKEVEKSIQYFERAIDIDSRYALAHAGLAESYFVLGGLGVRPPNDVIPKAKAAAAHALEIDYLLAEAHTSLSIILHLYDWDWKGAEDETRISIQLDPNNATTYRHYALYLADMGRFDEALDMIRKASSIKPLDAIVSRDVGQVLYYAGRNDEAIKALEDTLELDKSFYTAYVFLANAYEVNGLYDEAVAADISKEAISGSSPEVISRLKADYEESGWQGYWRKNLNLIKKKIAEGHSDPFHGVWVCMRLGDKEQALEWLEKSYNYRSVFMPTIKNDPLLKSLRSDPRFIDLQRRVGLEP
jgi:serine/threonine-protein kinase